MFEHLAPIKEIFEVNKRTQNKILFTHIVLIIYNKCSTLRDGRFVLNGLNFIRSLHTYQIMMTTSDIMDAN